MESRIKVVTTPNIMGDEFRKSDLNIRYFNMLNDPEPDLKDKVWREKYSDNEFIYEVIIRHAETKKHLREDYIYRSLSSVKNTLKRMISQYNQNNVQEETEP